MDRIQLKEKAKAQLKGHWAVAIGTVLVGTILLGLSASVNKLATQHGSLRGLSISLDIFSLIFDGFLTVGLCRFLLNYADNNDTARSADLFSQGNVFFKAMGLNLLYGLIVVGGCILLVVPGVIWALMFSQAFYILAEDNSKGIIECLRESKEMMYGKKLDLFILKLSFLGWHILAIFTLGILELWVNPYQKLTETYFYLDLSK